MGVGPVDLEAKLQHSVRFGDAFVRFSFVLSFGLRDQQSAI